MASRNNNNKNTRVEEEAKFVEESPTQAETVEEPVEAPEQEGPPAPAPEALEVAEEVTKGEDEPKTHTDEDLRAKAAELVGDDFDIVDVVTYDNMHVNVVAKHKRINGQAIYSFKI